MKRRPLIALGYRARVGKDFAGRMLESELGFARLKFADPVYRVAALLTRRDPTSLITDEAKEQFKGAYHLLQVPGYANPRPILGREVLQWAGTDLMRGADPGIWVALMRERILRLGPKAPIVITDCRFDNEVELVRSMGGQYWRIDRPSLGPAPTNPHASEAGPGVEPDAVFTNHDDDRFPESILGRVREWIL